MTPRPVASSLLEKVRLEPGLRVLDPGVGTGELLREALDREPGLNAVGWDVDGSVLEVARELVPEADLRRQSALTAEAGVFDLVVGNPPYFQLRPDPATRKRFAAVISGRANIFALFFQVALEQLRPGGILAYIVPPSMNSGAYFEALREYLIGRGTILDLTILKGTGIFEGANTAVQLLVIQKHKTSSGAKYAVGRKTGSGTGNPTHRGFVFEREVPGAGFRRVVFSPNPARLAAEFEGRRTLWDKGLEAVTGQVIWNENRDRLAKRPGPGRVPLIWSHDIGHGGFRSGHWSSGEGQGRGRPGKPGKPGKPGFYSTGRGGRPPLTGPAIVVNRVVGAVGRGELRAALVPPGAEFLAENHVNVIRLRRARNGSGSENRQQDRKSDPPIEGTVDWDEVLASLLAPGVAGRVRLLTGNTQISATEMTHLLPLG